MPEGGLPLGSDTGERFEPVLGLVGTHPCNNFCKERSLPGAFH